MLFNFCLALFGGILYLLFGVFAISVDPCSKNDHFTDTRFTCCGSNRYDAPTIYTSNDYFVECLQLPRDGGKIVKTSWLAFKCMIDKALGSGKKVDFENIEGILGEKLPDEIRTEIKASLKILIDTNYDPYKDNENLQEFKDYANAWNAYYKAENMACIKQGTKRQLDPVASSDCYSWIEQTIRRGDCCRKTPIPFELYPDPTELQYYDLKNYTAFNLMNLVGEYNWENTSIVMNSDNIAACKRTSLFILQGKVMFEKLKKDIMSLTPPNYKEITEIILPPYMSKEVRDNLTISMYNETEIQLEFTINDLMNTNTSIYKYIYAEEWVGKKFAQNETRFLFWHCRAYLLLNGRYKDLDISELCY